MLGNKNAGRQRKDCLLLAACCAGLLAPSLRSTLACSNNDKTDESLEATDTNLAARLCPDDMLTSLQHLSASVLTDADREKVLSAVNHPTDGPLHIDSSARNQLLLSLGSRSLLLSFCFVCFVSGAGRSLNILEPLDDSSFGPLWSRQVQSDGCLLVVTIKTGVVTHVSENILQILGVEPADVLTRPLSELFPHDAMDVIRGAEHARLEAERRTTAMDEATEATGDKKWDGAIVEEVSLSRRVRAPHR